MNDPHLIVHIPPFYASLVLMLYVGPDAVMPLLSLLGAIVGGVLMFWRRLTSLVRRVFSPSASKQEVSPKNPE